MEWLPDLGLDLFVTTIGFLLALFGEAAYGKIKELEDARQCINDIKKELIDIKEVIQKVNPEKNIYIDPIKTPIWDGITNTNKIQLLVKLQQYNKKKKNDEGIWYKNIFLVYNQIKEFNKWCNLLTNLIVEQGTNNNYTQAIINELKNMKENIFLKNSVDNIKKISLDEIIIQLDAIKAKGE